MTDPSVLADLLKLCKEAIPVIKESIQGPHFHELRGKLSADIIRSWIHNNISSPDIKKCALYYEIGKKSYVGAFMLAEDNSFVYSGGKPIAAVFYASQLDNELRDIFRSDTFAVLKF
jgi:hypothetical protein